MGRVNPKRRQDKIYSVYKEADIILLVTPLYYWMISGQLKSAFDRLEKHLGWNSIEKVLCSGVMAVGDIAGKAELQEDYELGKSII